MGLVFLAEGPDGSRVALKVLRPSIVGDAHGRTRLAREVTSLRRVRSPRIAEVYDADPWGETPYVVTRYVPGPSLREVVDGRGPLSGPALIRFARGLAQALGVVHSVQVLHRDVKPSNVLIEEGEPVLIDFGLAQLCDDMTLTQAGWLLGTPGYLAPEILYGHGPTPAADVHAWAATVTFAATGRGPYGTGPAMAIMDRVRRGEANLDGVPPDLGDVLAAALRSDPANRPTARQLVDWLDVLLDRSAPVAAGLARAPVRPPLPSADEGVFDWNAPGPSRTAAVTRQSLTGRDAEPARGRFRRIAFWVSMLLVVIASMVAAPVATWCWVTCAGWVLRTLYVGSTTLRAWRIARGPRRSDEVLTVLLIPWFALRRLAASVVNALCVAVSAGVLVVLARYGPDLVETPALVVAGLVAGLVSWSGPASHDLRRGGGLVTSRLPRSGLATASILVLLLGLACGLLAAEQVVGTTYTPFFG